MKVYIDDKGGMRFLGEMDLGPFGVIRDDAVYLGECEDFLDPDWDEDFPVVQMLLPEGGTVEERLRMMEKVCEYAYRKAVPYLEEIYNKFWYEICWAWYSTEYPIWGNKPDGDYYEYIIAEKMPVMQGMSQEDLTVQIYGCKTSQKSMGEFFGSNSRDAGKLFTSEIRRQMFPMVDFKYITTTWRCSIGIREDQVGSVSIHSDVADGNLFCAAMAELDKEYNIHSFHNH